MSTQIAYKTISLEYNTAVLDFYNQNDNVKGTLVLFPGFGQTVNAQNRHPLLNTIFNIWLKANYQIITVTTFMNNIQPLSPEQVKTYNYQSFQKLIDTCMETIYKSVQNPIHVIAHSTPTIPLTMHFNKQVYQGNKTPVASATFFAPFPTRTDILDAMKRVTPDPDTKNKIENFRPLALNLFEQVSNIDPKMMSKFNFPMTIICGNKDKIAPPNNTSELLTHVANPNIRAIFIRQNHNFSNLTRQDVLSIISAVFPPISQKTNLQLMKVIAKNIRQAKLAQKK